MKTDNRSIWDLMSQMADRMRDRWLRCPLHFTLSSYSFTWICTRKSKRKGKCRIKVAEGRPGLWTLKADLEPRPRVVRVLLLGHCAKCCANCFCLCRRHNIRVCSLFLGARSRRSCGRYDPWMSAMRKTDSSAGDSSATDRIR